MVVSILDLFQWRVSRMKKSLVSIAIVLSFASALFGFEWSGVVSNNTNVLTPDFKNVGINQSNGIDLSLTANLTKDKSLRFATEAMYKYDLVYADKKTTFINTADLSLLKFSGRWDINGSLLTMGAGRFEYSDKTGFVFGQESDGVSLNYTGRSLSCGFYAGYTGLLNRYTVNMTDNEKVKASLGQVYDLCYAYVPLMLDVAFTNVGGNYIGLQAEYFIDGTVLRADKVYGSIFAKGPLSNFGNYYVAATVGSTNFKNVMLRANLNLSFFIGESFMFGVGADYASGYNKVFSEFTPITMKPIHSTVAGVDAIVPRVMFSYVRDNFVLSVTEKLVTTIPQNFSVDGLDNNISVMYNVFSDLQLSSSISAYIDFDTKTENRYSASLNASFAF